MPFASALEPVVLEALGAGSTGRNIGNAAQQVGGYFQDKELLDEMLRNPALSSQVRVGRRRPIGQTESADWSGL